MNTSVESRSHALLAIACAVVGIALAGSYVDGRRADEADGAIRVLEQQTVLAQHARHTATLELFGAKRELARVRAHADSLEAIAHARKSESDRLAQLVRIASETLLVAAVTPDSTINVPVPRIVTGYIQSLYATIKAQDAALVARDTQAVRADTVIVTQDRIVSADTVVIETQGETITEEKKARPRFGFKSGLVAGATLIALIVHFVH